MHSTHSCLRAALRSAQTCLVVLVFGCLAIPAARAADDPRPPQTPRTPATNEYHGAKVTDEYQWLENWDDSKVQAWSEAQNAYCRAALDKLPAVKGVRERVTELETGASVEYEHLEFQGGKLFALKTQPPKQQPFVVVLKSADDTSGERTVVDPNVIDPKGGTSIDWFIPSPDGNLLAVSLSEGGSESGTVHVYDVATGKETGDVIPRVNGGTAGGSLAWKADAKGFYYTRYPRDGERPKEDMDFWMQVYSHTLGTPESKDIYEVGKDFPRIAEVILEVKGGYVLASIQNGDGGEFMYWLKAESDGPGNGWKQVTKWEDKVVAARLGSDGYMYMVSRKGAPRGKVIRTPLKISELARAEEVVPESKDAAISTYFADQTGLLPTDKCLYVWYQTGGPNEVRKFEVGDFKAGIGKPIGRIDSPPVSTIGEVVDLDNGRILYVTESFISPPAWFEHDPQPTAAESEAAKVSPKNPPSQTASVQFAPDRPTGKSRKTALFQTSPADFAGCEVVRETAASKDGTKVPISIIRAKGAKMDGSNPTVIWGYGGYGVSETPRFSPRRQVFVEQGGIFAIANIRGGGEFGEEWHLSGNLTKKQNVFDDFHAAAKHMIDAGYTKRERLALMGGSNGGLLMGATFTQHPDLCKAVVSSVGIYDMLRVELSPNGAFNVTEFGTVKNADHFKAMYAYSPYHNVKDGTKYPAVLMLTGANDPRVDPMQSRKMIARLQAADPTGLFLLRTSANAGHGIGASLNQRIEQSVDVYSFFFDQLGVEYRSPH